MNAGRPIFSIRHARAIENLAAKMYRAHNPEAKSWEWLGWEARQHWLSMARQSADGARVSKGFWVWQRVRAFLDN